MHKKSSALTLGVVVITLALMMAIPARAQMGQSKLTGARCGTKLIQIGVDTKSSVLKKCGKPTTESPGRRGGGAIWTYNRGTGRFMGIIRFTGPNLTSIEKADYGFAQPVYRED